MNKVFLIVIIVAFFFGISGIIFAEEFQEGIKLSEGKNLVYFSEEIKPIYASDLVKIYPEINAITYYEGDEEKGYVNVFGGVGENFVVMFNNTYEITVEKEVTLKLK